MSRETQTAPFQPMLRLFKNPYLLLALAGLFWAGNHIAGRAAAGEVPHISMAGMRWWIGAALMWPFVHRQVRRDLPEMIASWKVILPMIIGGGAIFSASPGKGGSGRRPV